MKYLKSFNEDKHIVAYDEHTNSDIRSLFIDYIDNDPDSLKIVDVLVMGDKVINKTTYISDVSKYRLAKKVTLRLGKSDGLSIGMDKMMTSFDILKKAIDEVERFYDLSGETEINYNFVNDFTGVSLVFIIMFGNPEANDDSKKIDDYIYRTNNILKEYFNFKKSVIKGNWLDITFTKKNDSSFDIMLLLRKVMDETYNLNNIDSDDSPRSKLRIDSIKLRNEMLDNGFKWDLSGGDQQSVIKIIKV